jgi:ureidoacrylate peracid hydrolase
MGTIQTRCAKIAVFQLGENPAAFNDNKSDYILRNLGIQQVILSGVLTDRCVESAIRDACDLGYLVTQVTDARQAASPSTIKGYCRQITTDELIAELD